MTQIQYLAIHTDSLHNYDPYMPLKEMFTDWNVHMARFSLGRSLFISKFFWLAINISFFNGAAGHLKRNPSQSNRIATALTQLTPEQPDFDSFNLDGALYNPSRTYISLSSLPSSCSFNHTLGERCLAEMRAVNVTYDDCSDAWTLCHCSSANITLEDSMSRLGKVPVGLRKFIGTTLVFPAEDAHAYTLTNGDIYFFGELDTDSWIHEATHAYDYAFGDPISGSHYWLDAIGNDTCATDVYGMTNEAEEFAQSSILKIFSLIYGSLPPGWNASCISHQQNFLDRLPLYDKNTLFADTCATFNGTNQDIQLAAVRPIKSNGPLPNLNAPLRIDPSADPIVSLIDGVPQSVSNDPSEKNSALSSGNSWLFSSFSFVILIIWK